MNRAEDDSKALSVMNVSAVRELFRRRVIEAKRDVVVLVRLAGGERRARIPNTPHVEQSADRGDRSTKLKGASLN